MTLSYMPPTPRHLSRRSMPPCGLRCNQSSRRARGDPVFFKVNRLWLPDSKVHSPTHRDDETGLRRRSVADDRAQPEPDDDPGHRQRDEERENGGNSQAPALVLHPPRPEANEAFEA